MNRVDAVCVILVSFYLVVEGVLATLQSLIIGREKSVMNSVKEYTENLDITKFVQSKTIYLLAFSTIQTINIIAIAYAIIAVKNNFAPYLLIALWLLSILALNSRNIETYKSLFFTQKIYIEKLKKDWLFHNIIRIFNVVIGTLVLKGMTK
jgi:hypothetical protein